MKKQNVLLKIREFKEMFHKITLKLKERKMCYSKNKKKMKKPQNEKEKKREGNGKNRTF